MEIKRDLQHQQLLQARAEALQQAERQALRPLGKLWGMDVFSWYNPSVYELSSTIQAFPFPVYWLGTAQMIQEMAGVDPETLRGLTWVGQYDHPQVSLPHDVLGPIPLVTATESLEDALVFVKGTKKARHILLFTTAGNEWKTNMQAFEAFVKLHAY